MPKDILPDEAGVSDDMYSAIPTRLLGTDYYAISYEALTRALWGRKL
ncbi:hypothetical protein GTO27_05955 [Candidatus Bathyarchaeota archaeon]|nr:hypothetical protein [Candidatus Bathyarchaeota archaeon]